METLGAKSYDLSSEFIIEVTECIEIKMGLSPGSIKPIVSDDRTSVEWMFENKILVVPKQFRMECLKKHGKGCTKNEDIKTRGENISMTDVVTGKIDILKAFEYGCEDVVKLVIDHLSESPVRYKFVVKNIRSDKYDELEEKYANLEHIWYRELGGELYLAYNDVFRDHSA